MARPRLESVVDVRLNLASLCGWLEAERRENRETRESLVARMRDLDGVEVSQPSILRWGCKGEGGAVNLEALIAWGRAFGVKFELSRVDAEGEMLTVEMAPPVFQYCDMLRAIREPLRTPRLDRVRGDDRGTREAIARILGVTSQTVYLWESGKSPKIPAASFALWAYSLQVTWAATVPGVEDQFVINPYGCLPINPNEHKRQLKIGGYA